jgi:hypothetical protein
MSSIHSHELQSVGSRQSSATPRLADAEMEPGGSNAEIDMRSLPPTDHGKQAYLVLAGCTLIQAPVWGERTISQLPSSY